MIHRRIVLGAALAATAPTLARAQALDPPLPPSLSTLLDLALTLPNGAATTLGAHLPPGPAVISFWATWCAPCQAEGRHLAVMRTRIAPERLAIVGINVDRTRDEDRIATFMQRARMNYTQLRGDQLAYEAFGGAPRIALPRLFVFAADGGPVAAFGRYNGGRTLRSLDRAVEAVLT